ncbi:hypothetical protein FSP39_009559 [Pinctada imbricata]|uniref:LITAF domain-containing protein n=1 Tax=Pinctada imbricata TaxID=66713 RepID=A0AA89BT95_PINIB|nr:hypothetical protein FSP39_009559 [Pinctada imbricata]
MSKAAPPPPPGYGAPEPPKYGVPPPAYQQTQGTYQTNVVVTGATPYLRNMMFREVPVATQCPFCQATITTSTSYETGTITWLVAGILLLIGLWLGCCLIPFCLDGCKDVIHRCPNCNQVVGKYTRM